MKQAAITGDYTDLRFIKGRKVCAITIEIPIERAQQFVAAFGTPNPAEGVPVALARLNVTRELEPEAQKPKREWKSLSRAQQAGIRCNEESFCSFLKEVYPTTTAALDIPSAVRKICKVDSRAELDTRKTASYAWDELETFYQMWLYHPELGA